MIEKYEKLPYIIAYMTNFIYLSRYAGMREDLVQAGGGNSSVKISSDKMVLKASGFQLADLSEEMGWCTVNPKIITNFFNQDTPDISKEVEKQLIANSLTTPSQYRPSIEIFLHSITQKYTLHTHPTVVNILTATDAGWKILKELFSDAVFVNYSTPGINLAAEYFNAVKKFGKIPNVIFLQNHGLVVSGETAEFVKEKTENVLRIIEKGIEIDMERYHTATNIYDTVCKIPELKNKIVYLSQNNDVIKGLENFSSNLWDYQFCPDCLVYCGKRILVLWDTFSETDFQNHLVQYGQPVIVTCKYNVYILADSVKKAKDIESVLTFNAQVAIVNKNSHINLLPDNEQNFLLNWDSEKYRQSAR